MDRVRGSYSRGALQSTRGPTISLVEGGGGTISKVVRSTFVVKLFCLFFFTDLREKRIFFYRRDVIIGDLI